MCQEILIGRRDADTRSTLPDLVAGDFSAATRHVTGWRQPLPPYVAGQWRVRPSDFEPRLRPGRRDPGGRTYFVFRSLDTPSRIRRRLRRTCKPQMRISSDACPGALGRLLKRRIHTGWTVPQEDRNAPRDHGSDQHPPSSRARRRSRPRSPDRHRSRQPLQSEIQGEPPDRMGDGSGSVTKEDGR